MSIVNFSIPIPLENKIMNLIKQKGFASKAEFFRFAAIYYIDILDKPVVDEEQRLSYLTKALDKAIRKKYTGKKLPSLEEQLAGI